MRRTLVVSLCCTLSLILAAPQDSQSANSLSTIKDSEQPQSTEDGTPRPPFEAAKSSQEDGLNVSQEVDQEESDSSEKREDSSVSTGAGAGSTTQKQDVGTDATATPATITITRPPKKPNKKPKPVRATTEQPVTQTQAVTVTAPVTAPVTATTASPVRRYPCRCGGGLCSCCTGIILENFNVPIRSRACANITYDPDEFAFNFKLLYNDRLLYNNRMSAKNPPPACITVNRYFGVRMCAKMTNVFLSGRNVHACLEFEGFWDDEPAFNYPFNCFRFGSEGVAFVRPEDGGGLPPPPDEEEQTDEDYDDSARGWTADVWPVPN